MAKKKVTEDEISTEERDGVVAVLPEEPAPANTPGEAAYRKYCEEICMVPGGTNRNCCDWQYLPVPEKLAWESAAAAAIGHTGPDPE